MYNNYNEDDFNQNIFNNDSKEEPPQLSPIELLSKQINNDAPSMETLNPMNIIPDNINQFDNNNNISNDILNNYDSGITEKNYNNIDVSVDSTFNNNIVNNNIPNSNIDSSYNDLSNITSSITSNDNLENNNNDDKKLESDVLSDNISNNDFINILSSLAIDIPKSSAVEDEKANNININHNITNETADENEKIKYDSSDLEKQENLNFENDILEEKNDEIKDDYENDILEENKLSSEQKVDKIKNIIDSINDDDIQIEEYDFEDTYQLIIKIKK